MEESYGLPRDHVVLDRRTGLYLRSIDGAIRMFTPNLTEAARFALVEILMQDLATVQNGYSFIHQDDPRLANNWPVTDQP